MLHDTNRCGRAGPAVAWFAALDRLTTPRGWIRMLTTLRG